ncbi:MAG: trypsin-like peptidase domain-containing protein, partial [Lachnospiraceae bacterium]|nr:trypsin-like peptidase domain-containing protein [Lachnospiraceae bacterium]
DNNFTQTINYFGQRYTQEQTGSGSGIIVGKSDDALLIATNYHVIEDADSLSVQFIDGESASAQVKDADPDMDLAVIAVPINGVKKSTMEEIVIATLGDSDSLVLGEPVIAIGNALGQGQSVTTGVVSALNREIELSDGSTGTFIQTDAAINPGNSGGALLNSAGEVIGINSNKFADTDVEGMGYAIPISTAQPIIDEMMNREIIADSDRGYLGITGATVPYEYTGIEGVRVRGVTAGSGAEDAGLQEDDIIIRLNGENIKSMESLQTKLKYCRAGDKVTLTILRRQNERYVEVDVDVKLSDAETAGIGSQNSSQGQDQQNGGQDGRQMDPYGGQDGGDGGNYYYYGGDDGGYGYSFPFSFPFFGGSY